MFESWTYTIQEEEFGPSQPGASNARWEYWVENKEGYSIHLVCFKMYHKDKPSRKEVVRVAKSVFEKDEIPQKDAVSWDIGE